MLQSTNSAAAAANHHQTLRRLKTERCVSGTMWPLKGCFRARFPKGSPYYGRKWDESKS
jgi:hypothetical protein